MRFERERDPDVNRVGVRSTTVERPSGSREVLVYEVSDAAPSHRAYVAAEADAVVSLAEMR